ncbi:MAG: response regulator, partial [Holophaga sp.]|nr:response regulator [Holophaga sp.]
DPQAYDVVLTDFSMPNLTGRELAELIWAIQPGFPVLLMTGYSEDLEETKAHELGFADLLRKPLPLQCLAKALRQTLDATQAGRN